MSFVWTDELATKTLNLAESGHSHSQIAEAIGVTKGIVSARLRKMRDELGIAPENNQREISVIPRADQIKLSNELLARLLKCHGDNPPDKASASAVDRIRTGLNMARAKVDREAEQRRREAIERLDAIHRAGEQRNDDNLLPAPRRMADVAREVCVKYEITMAELCGVIRTKHIVDARREACYRMVKECNKSTPHIGRFLGGRDHTTVIHAVRRYEEKLIEASQ